MIDVRVKQKSKYRASKLLGLRTSKCHASNLRFSVTVNDKIGINKSGNQKNL